MAVGATRSLLSAFVVLVAIAGCGGAQQQRSAPASPAAADVGPFHVHGLGVNSKDGSLLIATHTGLFRLADGAAKADRIGAGRQDTMGFTVVGPDRFLGSGHPDPTQDLPPLLGLIRSTDGGHSWQPVSLLGKADFHVLRSAGDRVAACWRGPPRTASTGWTGQARSWLATAAGTAGARAARSADSRRRSPRSTAGISTPPCLTAR